MLLMFGLKGLNMGNIEGNRDGWLGWGDNADTAKAEDGADGRGFLITKFLFIRHQRHAD